MSGQVALTPKALRDIAAVRHSNKGVTAIGEPLENMLEWRAADRIEELELENKRLRSTISCIDALVGVWSRHEEM